MADNSFDKTQVNWHISTQLSFQLANFLEVIKRRLDEGNLVGWFQGLNLLRIQYLDHEIIEQTKRKRTKIEQKENIFPQIIELDKIKHQSEIYLSDYRRYVSKAHHEFFKDKKIKLLRLAKISKHNFYQNTWKYHGLIMQRIKEVGYLPNKDNRWKIGF